MKNLSLTLLFAVAAALSSVAAAGPKVLASVHPLALVAASVTPADDLTVLVPMGMTPHDFSLRPSDVGRIRDAGIIFWNGPDAEPYLAAFTERWPDKTWLDVSVTPEDGHEHAGHEHEEHEHDVHAAAGHDAEEGDDDGHDHGHHDPHWWLSPLQMIDAQARLAAALGVSSGEFATAMQQQIELSRSQLEPYRDRGFFVFHRAYDRWVELMGLNQVGAFTVSPEQKPGLKTLQHMREQLLQGEVVCVFTEPEFSPAVVDSLLRGLDINRGELDPMAANIAIEPQGYVNYMQDLTRRFSECLGD